MQEKVETYAVKRYLQFVIVTLTLSLACGMLHYIRRERLLSDDAFALFYTPSSYLVLFLFSLMEKCICDKMGYNKKFYAVMLGISYLGTSMLVKFLMPF